jgi:hypothetical protein
MSLVARFTSLAQRDALSVTGIALSAAWLFLVALFWLMSPGGEGSQGGIARLVTIMGAILPLVLIWLAVGMARALAVLRAEADDLRHRLSQLRDVAVTRGGPPQRPVAEGTVADDADSLPRAPMPAPAPSRPAPRPAEQRAPAARAEPAPAAPVDPETLIRALNFPDGADDAPAIAALRTALQDPDHARVLRAAQDVVTLLAGQDLYMDDLLPDPAPLPAWRCYAQGERGSAVAPLGGIQDPVALDIAAGLLQRDEIFRDTAHHFLRHFDGMLARQLPQMDDAQIAVLAETRSARAFMLLGRLSGNFG